jgi:CRISPR/Cas system-associated endonuclease Cas3-HD
MKKYRILFSVCILLLITGMQKASGQEVIKSKKEMGDSVGRELGLDREKSVRLIARQEDYSAKVAAVLKDTSLRAQQRGMKLKALGEEQRSALKLILDPAQQEKMAEAIMVRSGGKVSQRRQQLEAMVPGKKGRSVPVDSNKVTPTN